MNISIEQYRATIGLHNNVKCRADGTTQPSNFWVLLFDSFYGLVSAAGICLTHIILIVSIFNYLFDIFNDMILYGHSTPSLSCTDQAVANPSKLSLVSIDYRIILSCTIYCIIYMIQESVILLSKSTENFLKKYLSEAKI